MSDRFRLLRLFLLLLLASLLALRPGAAWAQAGAVAEYTLKSALLFKLPQFVYRPDTARDQPVTLCLLGANPFGAALERLARSPIDGRAVKLLRLGSASEASGCDFIFIARSEAGALESTLRRLSSLAAVTVSDIEGFAKAGGMVEFAAGGDGVAVAIVINRAAARRQNIEFNAQLLRLARLIE